MEKIIEKLIEQKQSITCAESCTGGLIADEIVRHSGVSSIFSGSIVSYSNEIKQKYLGVKEQTLIDHGAVSKECVYEMLDGVMKMFDSDFAIAVSGVAGPEGGSLKKPVGTIIIGVKNRQKESIIKRFQIEGDRNLIRQTSVKRAFELLEEIFFEKSRKNS
jgi:nicotinamide-nucleotide amidase